MEVKVELGRLHAFVTGSLQRLDVPEGDASVVADSLVDAEATGQSGHGLIRFPFLLSRLKAGRIQPRPDMRLTHDATSSALLDADNGLGPVAGTRAMAIAAEKARVSGVGLCAVRRSNHLGAMGFYVEKGARDGLIALALSNTPPAMAAPGARLPFLGTNPIAAAFPTRDSPVVIDLATSQVARGRILKAARSGEAIPSGWGLDVEGRSTMDPAEAITGSLVPLGGAKGFALAMIVEALTGVLAGAAVGPQVGGTYLNSDRESDVGHCFIAIDGEALAPGSIDRMTALAADIRSLEPIDPAQPVRVPGDRRRRELDIRRASGVDVSQELIAELEAAAGANI
jgi:LDH2 family malate/lactate/ureidoglycolate dehydrogenase